MQKIKVGDVVQSSKNKMVVHSIENDKITCDWFEQKGNRYTGKLFREPFNKDELVVIAE